MPYTHNVHVFHIHHVMKRRQVVFHIPDLNKRVNMATTFSFERETGAVYATLDGSYTQNYYHRLHSQSQYSA